MSPVAAVGVNTSWSSPGTKPPVMVTVALDSVAPLLSVTVSPASTAAAAPAAGLSFGSVNVSVTEPAGGTRLNVTSAGALVLTPPVPWMPAVLPSASVAPIVSPTSNPFGEVRV